MQKYLTKEYFIFLAYKALSLGFMVVALNYFLFKSSIGGLTLNVVFFLLSVIFTMMSTNLKPALSLCLEKSGFLVSFLISVGNTISFMGIVLFLVYALNGEVMEMLNLLYFTISGVVFGTAYFYKCAKK